MPVRPPLAPDTTLPRHVNGWTYTPDDTRNAHIWTATDPNHSVGIYLGVTDTIRVQVTDDRVHGFANQTTIATRDIPSRDARPDATAWAVDRAVDWMTRHEPGAWTHPRVAPTAFNPPTGYVLARYYLEERDTTLYYRRRDTPPARALDTRPDPDAARYLYIHTWAGSGDSTIATAPWLHAHDHHLTEVADPPTNCGLEIALKYAREYAATQPDTPTRDQPAGQQDIARWSP